MSVNRHTGPIAGESLHRLRQTLGPASSLASMLHHTALAPDGVCAPQPAKLHASSRPSSRRAPGYLPPHCPPRTSFNRIPPAQPALLQCTGPYTQQKSKHKSHLFPATSSHTTSISFRHQYLNHGMTPMRLIHCFPMTVMHPAAKSSRHKLKSSRSPATSSAALWGFCRHQCIADIHSI